MTQATELKQADTRGNSKFRSTNKKANSPSTVLTVGNYGSQMIWLNRMRLRNFKYCGWPESSVYKPRAPI